MNVNTIGNYDMKQEKGPKSGLKEEKKKEQVTKLTVLFIPKYDLSLPRVEIKTLHICKYYKARVCS